MYSKLLPECLFPEKLPPSEAALSVTGKKLHFHGIPPGQFYHLSIFYSRVLKRFLKGS